MERDSDERPRPEDAPGGEEQFEGAWLDTQVGRQVSRVVRSSRRARAGRRGALLAPIRALFGRRGG